MELVDKWETEGKITKPTATKYNDTLTYLKNTSHPIKCFDHNSGTEETVPGFHESRRLPHQST